jgi:hypothetical protein
MGTGRIGVGLRDEVGRRGWAGHWRQTDEVGISTFVTDEGMSPGPLAAAVEERAFNSLCVTEHSHIPVVLKESLPGGCGVPREYHRTLDRP